MIDIPDSDLGFGAFAFMHEQRLGQQFGGRRLIHVGAVANGDAALKRTTLRQFEIEFAKFASLVRCGAPSELLGTQKTVSQISWSRPETLAESGSSHIYLNESPYTVA